MYLTLECICFSNLDNREHDVGYLLQAPQPALCAAPTDSTLWAAAGHLLALAHVRHA